MADYECTWANKDLSKYSFKHCKARTQNKNVDKRIASIDGLTDEQILERARNYKSYDSVSNFVRKYENKLSKSLVAKLYEIRKDKRREYYYKYDSPIYAPKYKETKSFELTDQDYLNKIDKYQCSRNLRDFIKKYKENLSELLINYANNKLKELIKQEYNKYKHKIKQYRKNKPKVIKPKKEVIEIIEKPTFTSTKPEIEEESQVVKEIQEYKKYQENKNKMFEDYLAKGGKITNLDEVFGTSLEEY